MNFRGAQPMAGAVQDAGNSAMLMGMQKVEQAGAKI